jgi:hypothetical protein
MKALSNMSALSKNEEKHDPWFQEIASRTSSASFPLGQACTRMAYTLYILKMDKRNQGLTRNPRSVPVVEEEHSQPLVSPFALSSTKSLRRRDISTEDEHEEVFTRQPPSQSNRSIDKKRNNSKEKERVSNRGSSSLKGKGVVTVAAKAAAKRQ